MTNALKRFYLDLPDSFACHADGITDLLKCLVVRQSNTESQPQDPLLPLRQLEQCLGDRPAKLTKGRRLERAESALINQLAGHRIKTDIFGPDLQKPGHLPIR